MGSYCGVISRMRHFVPKSVLLKYLISNVKPTMQFGLLVYVGTSYTLLNQLLMMQRKIPRIIKFKKNFENITQTVIDNKILSAHELYLFVLLKFCFSSMIYGGTSYAILNQLLMMQRKTKENLKASLRQLLTKKFLLLMRSTCMIY